MLRVDLGGTNATSAQTTRAAIIENYHLGTTSTNIGADIIATNGTTNIAGMFSATSGTNNYAIIVPSGGGNVGIGTSAPDSALTVNAGIWGKRGIRFSGLSSASNATDSMLVVNATTGNVGYRAIPAGGATPAGNYGNVQLNRNGAFATPASDSLSFGSAALNVKGDVSISDGRYLKIGGSNLLNYSTGSNNATFGGAYNYIFNNGGNVFMNGATTTYFNCSNGDLYLSNSSSKLGIGTASPSRQLHVAGKSLFTDSLKYSLGASNGYVLTSDANGNATWQAAGGGGSSLFPTTGTGTATGDVLADMASHAVTVSQTTGGAQTNAFRPYKVYTALLTQSGTSAPTATVLENTIGAIVWTRNGAGEYYGTLSGAFTSNKTWCSPPLSANTGDFVGVQVGRLDNNIVVVKSLVFGNSDDELSETAIEIRVYQ